MYVDVSLHGTISRAQHAGLAKAILHTLSYADVFDYPMTAAEVHRYLTGQAASMTDVTTALAGLVGQSRIVHVGGWFALSGREQLAESRVRRGTVATGLWKAAVSYTGMIASLPYVRMVAVTGSLAMGNTERGNDIDFMLITAPGRLWTCRAWALLIGRLAALQGLQLCPNYLVTTDALEFPERSLYVAHEVAQMIPLFGMEAYSELRRVNAWTNEYLPNALDAPRQVPVVRASARRALLGAALAIAPVARFERWEMERKIRKLSREQASSPESEFTADICKGHANRHMTRTETLIKERLKGLQPL